MVMRLEKAIMTEFLDLYRRSPCLWDRREIVYCNRLAREKAYEELLVKYRELQEDAEIPDVKKKIEHMRATYRREHKKVLKSRLNGDHQDYVPQLWYYDLLSFLNEVADFSKLESSSTEARESVKIEHQERQPASRKRKLSVVYLPENDMEPEESDDGDDNSDSHQNSRPVIDIHTSKACATESYGTTIGLQLKELDDIQRVIAEKLIADVIFNGRLNRLTVQSSLNV